MLIRSTLAFAFGLSLAGAVQAAPITGFGDPLTDPLLVGGAQQGFDSVNDGEYAALTIGGITYTGMDGSFSVGSDYNGNYNTTGGKSVFNNFDYMPRQFRFDFIDEVTAFAFNFGASDENWMLQAFDTTGALIDQLIIHPVLASNDGDYFGLSSGGQIAYALLTLMSNDDDREDDFVFLDRFTTKLNKDGSDVPLPAALPLLASGIAGVAAMKRRKRKA